MSWHSTAATFNTSTGLTRFWVSGDFRGSYPWVPVWPDHSVSTAGYLGKEIQEEWGGTNAERALSDSQALYRVWYLLLYASRIYVSFLSGGKGSYRGLNQSTQSHTARKGQRWNLNSEQSQWMFLLHPAHSLNSQDCSDSQEYIDKFLVCLKNRLAFSSR